MAILTNSTDFVAAATMSWQQYLKDAVRTPQQLASRLKIPVEGICSRQAGGDFPLLVPEPYLRRIRSGDLNDPLLLQVLPKQDESDSTAGYTQDPLNENQFDRGAGLLQKYSGRALLVVNGACAVHCRYCFRRNFPYSDAVDVQSHWAAAVEDLSKDESVTEIILSGGDPLTLVDSRLHILVDKLSEIRHLKRLRIHSRLPIVIPQRVTEKLLETLADTRLEVNVVLHSNHANELDGDVELACRKLKHVCNMLLNQSVLMHRINDTVESLVALSERLVECAVVPYYLHKLDSVEGAAHFDVSLERGIELVDQVRARLPGYMVPRFVQEIPGQSNKTVLA